VITVDMSFSDLLVKVQGHLVALDATNHMERVEIQGRSTLPYTELWNNTSIDEIKKEFGLVLTFSPGDGTTTTKMTAETKSVDIEKSGGKKETVLFGDDAPCQIPSTFYVAALQTLVMILAAFATSQTVATKATIDEHVNLVRGVLWNCNKSPLPPPKPKPGPLPGPPLPGPPLPGPPLPGPPLPGPLPPPQKLATAIHVPDYFQHQIDVSKALELIKLNQDNINDANNALHIVRGDDHKTEERVKKLTTNAFRLVKAPHHLQDLPSPAQIGGTPIWGSRQPGFTRTIRRIRDCVLPTINMLTRYRAVTTLLSLENMTSYIMSRNRINKYDPTMTAATSAYNILMSMTKLLFMDVTDYYNRPNDESIFQVKEFDTNLRTIIDSHTKIIKSWFDDSLTDATPSLRHNADAKYVLRSIVYNMTKMMKKSTQVDNALANLGIATDAHSFVQLLAKRGNGLSVLGELLAITQTYTFEIKQTQGPVSVYLRINQRGDHKSRRFHLSKQNDNQLSLKWKAYPMQIQPKSIQSKSFFDRLFRGGSNTITAENDGNFVEKEFYFGPFVDIFENSNTNEDVAKNISNIQKPLEANKSVFVIGYGSSGAGKTSTLINFKGNQRLNLAAEQGILVSMLNKVPYFKDKIAKIAVEVTEFWVAESDLQMSNHDSTNAALSHVDSDNFKKTTEAVEFTFVSDGVGGSWRTTTGNVDLGEYLANRIDNADSRRVSPTPNNPRSSRSHVLADLCLHTKEHPNADKPAHLFIGDFAGVEDEFQCTNLDVLAAMANMPLDETNKLEERRFYHTDHNIAKEWPLFGMEHYMEYGAVSKDAADRMKLPEPFNVNSQSTSDAFIRTILNDPNTKADWMTNVNMPLIYGDLMLEMDYPSNSSVNDLVGYIRDTDTEDKLNKLDAAFSEKRESMSDLEKEIAKTLSRTRTYDVKLVKSRNPLNPGFKSTKVILNNYDMRESVDKRLIAVSANVRNIAMTTIAMTNPDNVKLYQSFADKIPNDTVLKFLSEDKPIAYESQSNLIEALKRNEATKKIPNLDVDRDVNLIKSSINFLPSIEYNNKSEYIQKHTVHVAGFTVELTITITPIVTTKAGGYEFQVWPEISLRLNATGPARPAFDKLFKHQNEYRACMLYAIATIKTFLRMRKLCNYRVREGKHINKTIANMRASISTLVHHKTLDRIMYVPQFASNECYAKVCGFNKPCFDIDHLSITPSGDDYRSEVMATYILPKLANPNDLNIVVFGVFNNSIEHDKLPKQPYVDIRKLKYAHLLANYKSSSGSSATVTQYKPRGLPPILTELISDIDRIMQTHPHLGVILSRIRDAAADTAGNVRDNIKLIISLIDMFNSTSPIGTLEFMDQMAKGWKDEQTHFTCHNNVADDDESRAED